MANEQLKQLIIAGNRKQAEYCAKSRGLTNSGDWHQITDSFDLQSLRRIEGRTVWLYGTYYTRPGWREMRALCDACGLVVVEVGDEPLTVLERSCSSNGDYTKEQLCAVFNVPTPNNNEDIELTCRALKACGYRVHIKERAGSQWVTALKGLGVRYEHWHPLTNINQAMQLLQDAPGELTVLTTLDESSVSNGYLDATIACSTALECGSLIAAQCRAIVTACASLEVVR